MSPFIMLALLTGIVFVSYAIATIIVWALPWLALGAILLIAVFLLGAWATK